MDVAVLLLESLRSDTLGKQINYLIQIRYINVALLSPEMTLSVKPKLLSNGIGGLSSKSATTKC